MPNDSRDILELLKEELAFIEKRGYDQSSRDSWTATTLFQDSETCLNYGYPYRAHPCNECHLIEFVAQEHQLEAIPCHHIVVDDVGTTIADFETKDDRAEMERRVEEWLRSRIQEIEAQRAGHAIPGLAGIERK